MCICHASCIKLVEVKEPQQASTLTNRILLHCTTHGWVVTYRQLLQVLDIFRCVVVHPSSINNRVHVVNTYVWLTGYYPTAYGSAGLCNGREL